MEILQTTIVLIVLMGSLQGLFLAYILANKNKFNKKSNLYLAIFLLAFSLSNLHYVAKIYGITQQYSWLEYLSFPWTFLIPIVFYFFIKNLLNPKHEITKNERWLYFPFLIQFVFHTVLFLLELFDSSFLETYEYSIFLLDVRLETILSLLINLIFIPLIYKMIYTYEVNLKDNYSEISQSSIEWLKRLVLILIGIWFFWAFPALYQVFTGITTPILDLMLWCMMSICIYWIGYATYFQDDVFFAEWSFPSTNIPNTRKEQGIAKHPVKQDRKNQVEKIDVHFERMIELIEKEQLYTDSDFSLSMLAEKCQLSANYLSQIINKKTSQNFYTLVNDYRVEEVKRMLLDSEYHHYSILSIGLEAGFKSKSSFYKVFKEKTEMTPSQYQKSQVSFRDSY